MSPRFNCELPDSEHTYITAIPWGSHANTGKLYFLLLLLFSFRCLPQDEAGACGGLHVFAGIALECAKYASPGWAPGKHCVPSLTVTSPRWRALQ